MFDIDLYEQTATDVCFVDCNGNGFANSEVIRYKGDKNLIIKSLVDGFVLEEVRLDMQGSSVFRIKIKDFDYIGESIPIISGIDSLIYHGFEKPLLHEKVERLSVDKDTNSIKIIRLLPSFLSRSKEGFYNYFDSVNSCLKKWIDDLNLAIKFHNEQIIKCAEKHAESLHNLYKNHKDWIK